MKKYIFLFVVLLGISTANAGLLPFGGYIGFRGGTTTGGFPSDKDGLKVESDPGFLGSVNAGIRFFRLRGEIEGLARYKGATIKADNGEKETVNSITYLGNGYYNLVELPFIRVFIGAGVGYTKFNSGVLFSDKSLAYNAGLGASFTLMDIFSIDVGYRYFHQGDFEIGSSDDKTKYAVNSNDIYAGFRMGF
jgi:opacity protein-like surface antigen